MITKQIVLASRPKGIPTLKDFRFEDIQLPEMHAGDVLLKGLYYSVDPYMRGRMNEGESYTPAFKIDQPIEGSVIAIVSKSNSDNFKSGELVLGGLPWREQFIANEKDLEKMDPSIKPASYYLDILGMTGLTAYIGLIHIGKPKAGETVVISCAAGAVGIVAGQIAKLMGCRVIGIAGEDEKVTILKEKFGFDEAVNYKTTSNIKKAIAKVCPNGVDIYFDNVGGEISDAVVANINLHGRIILCGQISLYNNMEIPIGPRLEPLLISRNVLMQGFIVRNYQALFPEAIGKLAEWVKAGKLQFTETIVHGFDQLPNALLGLFKGENIGKMLVEA